MGHPKSPYPPDVGRGPDWLSRGFQKQGPKRRQGEIQRVGTAVSGFVFGVYAAEISLAGAAVFKGIAVQQFAPVAAFRHAHTIAETRDGREVTNDEHRVFSRLALAQ